MYEPSKLNTLVWKTHWKARNILVINYETKSDNLPRYQPRSFAVRQDLLSHGAWRISMAHDMKHTPLRSGWPLSRGHTLSGSPPSSASKRSPSITRSRHCASCVMCLPVRHHCGMRLISCVTQRGSCAVGDIADARRRVRTRAHARAREGARVASRQSHMECLARSPHRAYARPCTPTLCTTTLYQGAPCPCG